MNQSDTPRSTHIRHNIHVAMVADTREQSILHLEEAHREIEAMEEELTAARAEADGLEEQRDAWREMVLSTRAELVTVTEQRDRLLEVVQSRDTDRAYHDQQWNKLRDERDRLAVALARTRNMIQTHPEAAEICATEALQSLTPTEQ